jgi:hypothetical protein
MNRRNFLHAVSASSAAALIPAKSFGWPAAEPLPMPASSVHVLGMPATDAAQRLMRMLSDDVFEQLRLRFRKAYPSGGLVVTDGQYIGDRNLTHVWHTATKVHPQYAVDRPPAFDLTDFRARTTCWIQGYRICYGSPNPQYATPVTEIFDGTTRVGIEILPFGLLWAAHYLDEDTGLTMRACTAWDVITDEIIGRWSVLVG